jgi:hypothetical protein
MVEDIEQAMVMIIQIEFNEPITQQDSGYNLYTNILNGRSSNSYMMT